MHAPTDPLPLSALAPTAPGKSAPMLFAALFWRILMVWMNFWNCRKLFVYFRFSAIRRIRLLMCQGCLCQKLRSWKNFGCTYYVIASLGSHIFWVLTIFGSRSHISIFIAVLHIIYINLLRFSPTIAVGFRVLLQFLPARRYASAVSTCPSVCLSVCLSVTRRYCA